VTAAAQRASGDTPALPAHIAIIMDGNGRWAKAKGVARARGHQQGGEALRRLLEACRTRPFIRQLTLYAFSIENWDRSPDEVNDLMNLLRHYVKREADTLHKNNVRLQFIGELSALPEDIQRDLAQVRALTAGNTGLTVAIAVSYGARQELVTAMKRIGATVASGALQPSDITEDTLRAHLHTAESPDPDLLIRTGGEHRLSNFLLWQSAYTELYFSDVLWPDFTSTDLDAAIEDFSQRERRYGKRLEG
jgi:undecaprenyl diphosphate synthase